MLDLVSLFAGVSMACAVIAVVLSMRKAGGDPKAIYRRGNAGAGNEHIELNPQPLPPGIRRPPWWWLALNPQPLPPGYVAENIRRVKAEMLAEDAALERAAFGHLWTTQVSTAYCTLPATDFLKADIAYYQALLDAASKDADKSPCLTNVTRGTLSPP